MEMWTLDALEADSTTILPIGDKAVKIQAVDPKIFIILLDGKGIDINTSQNDVKSVLANMDVLDEVCVQGLLEPKVTKETLGKLGRHKQAIAEGILKFSGLAKETAQATEDFR